MAQKKTGKPLGRTSFQGTKLSFLESFKSEFLEILKTNDATNFYSKVAHRFALKYGFDLDLHQDINEEEVPEDDPMNAVDAPGISEEERTRRVQYVKDLRPKLAQWFRHRYTGKKSSKDTVADFLKGLGQATPCPRRQSPINLYSQLYFKDEMKQEFLQLWSSTKGSVPATERLNMYRRFVAQRWKEEDEEVKMEVKNRVESEYASAMEKYKASKNTRHRRTAEDYHEALRSADEVLIPIIDAISERFGLHAVLMLVGPLGSEGGRVEVRSVHSDTSEGMTNLTWPKYDRNGFTEASASFSRYGRAFFSKVTCEARVFMPGDGDEAGPSRPDGGDSSTPDLDKLDGNHLYTLDPSRAGSSYSPDRQPSPPRQPSPSFDQGQPPPLDLRTSENDSNPETSSANGVQAPAPESRSPSSESAVDRLLQGLDCSEKSPPPPDGAVNGMQESTLGETHSPPTISTSNGVQGPDTTGDCASSSDNNADSLLGQNRGENPRPPVTSAVNDAQGLFMAESHPSSSNRSLSDSQTPRPEGGSLPPENPAVNNAQGLCNATNNAASSKSSPGPLLNPAQSADASSIQPQGSNAHGDVGALKTSVDRSGWPDRVNRAFDYFIDGKDWGKGWARCVAAWSAFERARAFNSSKKLLIGSRPPEVSAWMKNARPWTDFPVGADFPEGCRAWWRELQPAGREIFDREVIQDWGSLNAAGPGGTMLLLIVLAWWRCGSGNECVTNWEYYVEDVAWVLENMKTCEPAAGSKARVSERSASTGGTSNGQAGSSSTRTPRKRKVVEGAASTAKKPRRS